MLTTLPGNVFRQSCHGPHGPSKVMKNASVQQPLSKKPSPFPLSFRAYPDFLLHRSHRCRLCGSPQREPHHMQSTEAATLDRKFGEAYLSRRAVEESALQMFFDRRSHGLRPTEGNENASVRHPLSVEPLPFPCHPACPGVPWDRSEAERRDLRFRGPFWKCVSTSCHGPHGPPRMMKTPSARGRSLMEALPSPLSSRPKRSAAERSLC